MSQAEELQELVQELGAKKRQIREAEGRVDDAKVALAERRRELGDLRRGLEEIEDELIDPGKRRPLLAAAAARPETADEHQRGPTAIELPGVELPLPEQPRRKKRQAAGSRQQAAGPAATPAEETELERLASRHWDVHEWAASPPHKGARLGTQLARDLVQALRRATDAWPDRKLIIGDSHPHGPDCGCPTADAEPEIIEAARPKADEDAAPAGAHRPGTLKQWTVHERLGQDGRGNILGTVTAKSSVQADRILADLGHVSASSYVLSGRREAPAGGAPPWQPAADVVIDPMAATLPQWSISRKLKGLNAAEVLGIVRAEDEPTALAHARRQWPGELLARPVPTAPEKPKPASKREPIVMGPMNQDDALDVALKLLPSACLTMLAAGATASDESIIDALNRWPTRWTEGSSRGNAWGVHGSPPQFWYDAAAIDDFRRGKSPTLAGPELVAAVRRVRHIRKPRATAADRKPVRAERTARP